MVTLGVFQSGFRIRNGRAWRSKVALGFAMVALGVFQSGLRDCIGNLKPAKGRWGYAWTGRGEMHLLFGHVKRWTGGKKMKGGNAGVV